MRPKRYTIGTTPFRKLDLNLACGEGFSPLRLCEASKRQKEVDSDGNTPDVVFPDSADGPAVDIEQELGQPAADLFELLGGL